MYCVLMVCEARALCKARGGVNYIYALFRFVVTFVFVQLAQCITLIVRLYNSVVSVTQIHTVMLMFILLSISRCPRVATESL